MSNAFFSLKSYQILYNNGDKGKIERDSLDRNQAQRRVVDDFLLIHSRIIIFNLSIYKLSCEGK